MKLLEHLNLKRLYIAGACNVNGLFDGASDMFKRFLVISSFFHFLSQGAKGKSGGKGSKGDGGEKVRT